MQLPVLVLQKIWKDPENVHHSFADKHNRQIDWLIIYSFTSRSRIFHLYGDVTIAGEGLQI
jgi:hypothetical protein